MFRNLVAAIVSVCAVSTGSPAWSQNSPVEPTPPQNSPVEPTSPTSDQQYVARSFEELRKGCYKIQIETKQDCMGEEARLLFKHLGEKSPARTTETPKRWLRRDNGVNVYPWVVCWARDDGGGDDPIASMIYKCRIQKL
jgi:hypothetical protein